MNLLHVHCPACRFPRLEARTGDYVDRPAGETADEAEPVRVGGVEFCVCPRCGQQTVLDEQLARNRERVAVARLEAAAAKCKWAMTRVFAWPADDDAVGAPAPADG